MIERRASDYWFPPAWRGVASPSVLYTSRWNALVEELGGLRAPAAQKPRATKAAAAGPDTQAGLVNMAVLESLNETEQLEELQQFVAEQLSRHERLVLMLVYASGLSLDEIATVLDLPEATVSEIYSRTLATLRARFG